MDCEKFEDAIMDELYGELDEVTSAAVRRHASTCAKCGDRLASLRATRKVLASAFVPVAAPASLEDRILAAAREATTSHVSAPPMRVLATGSVPESERAHGRVRRGGERRITHLVSVAGRWAMRPQTAMAAVFLLMIGSSVVLMRGRSMSPSAVVVTERGAPAETTTEGTGDKNELAAAPNAHGPDTPLAATAPAPVAAAAPKSDPAATPAASAAGALALNERQTEAKKAADDLDYKGRAATGGAAAGPAGESRSERELAMATPPAAPRPTRPAARAAEPSTPPAAPPPAQVAPGGSPPSTQTSVGGGASFADALAAYRGQRYADALRMFDALAAQGDSAAALWAARSERQASGCAAASSRFDRVAASSYGTTVGYDATLEAGRCYRQLGSFEAARGRFARLLTVPSHAPSAQAELDAMNPQRARQGAPPPAAKPSTAEGL